MNSYLWKINNYSNQKEQVTIISESFYCEKYRFHIKIFPNGDGVGRYTHLSAFFCLMKGENDEKLQWPFREVIQMSLLNGPEEVIFSDKIKTYTHTVCFNKPGDDANTGTGFSKFYPLDRLESQMWYNDTISIKFEIVELLPPRLDNKPNEQVLHI